MLRKRQGRILFSCVGLLLVGCVATTPSTAVTPLSEQQQPLAALTVSASQAIPYLLVAERQGAATRDHELLAQLWLPEGRVIDERSSKEPIDDYVWEGRAAVLDRYILAVFPAPPPSLSPDGLLLSSVIVEGDHATATNGGDQWTFAWRNGQWWISELRYNQ